MSDVFGWLDERGWSGSFLRDGRWEDIDSFDVERDQTAHLAELRHPAYVNNFRFDARPTG